MRVLIDSNPAFVVTQPSGVSGTREIVAIIRLGDESET